MCNGCCVPLTQAGDVPANPAAGRKLMEAISCIPQMEEAKFESILNSTMQVWTSRGSLTHNHQAAFNMLFSPPTTTLHL